MALFTGPLLTDQSGANSGSALNAADLNAFAVAQSFWMNPVAPTFATMTLTWSSAPQGVVNTGATAGYVVASSASYAITPAGSGAQDYYVFLLNTGSYSAINVNSGTALSTSSYPANGFLVGRATTNSSNNAIVSVSIALCTTTPFPTGGMLVDGSNATAVAFPSSLSVAGATTLSAGLAVTGAASVSGLSTLTGGATLGADLNAGNHQLKNASAVGAGTSSPVGALHVAGAIPATANNGLVNLGAGAFDGVSLGHFAGNGAGTLLAGNAPSSFTGDVLRLQVGGADAFRVSSSGGVSVFNSLTTTGPNTLGGHILSTGNTPSITPAGGSAGGTGQTATIVRGTDAAGTISFTTGTGVSSTGPLLTVTFASAYSSTPQAALLCISADVGPFPALLYLCVYSLSTTGFQVTVQGSGSLSNNTTYKFHYLVIG